MSTSLIKKKQKLLKIFQNRKSLLHYRIFFNWRSRNYKKSMKEIKLIRKIFKKIGTKIHNDGK